MSLARTSDATAAFENGKEMSTVTLLPFSSAYVHVALKIAEIGGEDEKLKAAFHHTYSVIRSAFRNHDLDINHAREYRLFGGVGAYSLSFTYGNKGDRLVIPLREQGERLYDENILRRLVKMCMNDQEPESHTFPKERHIIPRRHRSDLPAPDEVMVPL